MYAPPSCHCRRRLLSAVADVPSSSSSFCQHLDMESVDALIRALQVFAGGVVIVSHDWRLVSSLEDCEIWICDGGLTGPDGIEGTGLRVERRGFDHYRTEKLKEIARKQAALEKAVDLKAAQRRQAREDKLQQAKERRRGGKSCER